MGSDELIDGRVSRVQSQKAVTALLQHVRKGQQQAAETELLPAKEQYVWLVLAVKRMQPMKKLKPQRIPLAHPLVDPRTSAVCLVTKDPQREYKDLLEAQDIKFISRVVGVQKLRGKFKGFDARRLLLRENDLFLADERVLPILPRLLGKKWFEAKKQPIPVSLTKKALKAELEKAVSSTYMHQNQGTCTSIKIATTSHKDAHVLANLVTALPAFVARIHGGWDNVQSLNIKTSDSVSLPIWTCPLGAEEPGSRWDGMVADENEWGGIGSEAGQVVVEDETSELVKDTAKTNGKKRAAEETQEGTQDVTKKAKKAKRSGDSSSAPIAVAAKRSKESESAIAAKEPQPTKLSPPGESGLAGSGPTPTRSSKAQKPLASASDSGRKKAGKSPAVSSEKGLLSRTEMAEKKGVLESTKLTKKKEKLRDPEKSVRKGVKAGLVGRNKA